MSLATWNATLELIDDPLLHNGRLYTAICALLGSEVGSEVCRVFQIDKMMDYAEEYRVVNKHLGYFAYASKTYKVMDRFRGEKYTEPATACTVALALYGLWTITLPKNTPTSLQAPPRTATPIQYCFSLMLPSARFLAAPEKTNTTIPIDRVLRLIDEATNFGVCFVTEIGKQEMQLELIDEEASPEFQQDVYLRFTLMLMNVLSIETKYSLKNRLRDSIRGDIRLDRVAVIRQIGADSFFRRKPTP